MDDYSEHITEAVRVIEAFYPEYLERLKLEDSLLARAMFYGLMIEMTEKSPDYPYKAQVLEILENRNAFAHDGLRAGLMNNPE